MPDNNRRPDRSVLDKSGDLTSVIFELGHFEQLQIWLALNDALICNSDLDEDERSISIDTIEGLQRIFASHGTVTVTRTLS